MKRAPLTAFGAIVSLLTATAIQPATAGDPHAAAIRSQLSAAPGANGQTHSAVDVPRGNLRGDIVNNARSHPEAPQSGSDGRAHAKARQESH